MRSRRSTRRADWLGSKAAAAAAVWAAAGRRGSRRRCGLRRRRELSPWRESRCIRQGSLTSRPYRGRSHASSCDRPFCAAGSVLLSAEKFRLHGAPVRPCAMVPISGQTAALDQKSEPSLSPPSLTVPIPGPQGHFDQESEPARIAYTPLVPIPGLRGHFHQESEPAAFWD